MDDPMAWFVCQSVLCRQLHFAKMAERIDVVFGLETPGDPRYIVLDGVPGSLFTKDRMYANRTTWI